MTRISSRVRRTLLTAGATSVAVIAMLVPTVAFAPVANADPGLSTQDLTGSLTADQLANALVGSGVVVSNAQFTGASVAGGTFAGGGTGPGSIIGFDQGVVLSSGAVSNVVGPNVSDGISTENGQPGDADLNELLPVGQSTFDAAGLTFDFIPNASSVQFQYVFSSDEYNEFVGAFNDVFGFFVNGTNCATVDGQPVSVDTINGGNPFGTNASHPELFRNNDPNDPGPPTIDTEMDGLTVVLTCTAAVVPNQTNTMKLAIADVGDSSLDSNVFIASGSLTTSTAPGAPTGVTATPSDGSATVGWTAPTSDGGSPIDGYEATCTATGNPDDVQTASVDGSTTSAQVTGLTNGVEYTCAVRAHNANGFGPSSDPSAPFTPSGAEFSMTIDTSQGGTLHLIPTNRLGTIALLTIPPQPGPATDVLVTASFFGVPGEADPTCGGNVCIGQGVEWAVSDPSAVGKMRLTFFEARRLVDHRSPSSAVVYKDGLPLPDCHSGRDIGCVRFRASTKVGGWRVSIRVDGSDPKGRI